MEALQSQMAFDPKRAKPGPKRSSLLIKQGFTNVSGGGASNANMKVAIPTTAGGNKKQAQAAKDSQVGVKKSSPRKTRSGKAQANSIFNDHNMNRLGVALEKDEDEFVPPQPKKNSADKEDLVPSTRETRSKSRQQSGTNTQLL